MFSFQKKVVRVKERKREGEYVLFRNKKKNNDNSNNKLTKGKSDESTTKVMFHEELCLVAVYREAEEEACAVPIGERCCLLVASGKNEDHTLDSHHRSSISATMQDCILTIIYIYAFKKIYVINMSLLYSSAHTIFLINMLFLFLCYCIIPFINRKVEPIERRRIHGIRFKHFRSHL